MTTSKVDLNRENIKRISGCLFKNIIGLKNSLGVCNIEALFLLI